MALPVVPLALAGAAALWLLTSGKTASAGYSQAPADGSRPPVKEPAPAAKTWKEMPPALQEQVAAALGALGVSPATGELSGQPVSAEAMQMATQTAALCESQGFFEVAKELQRLIKQAAPSVPTPAAAAPIQAAAPPGLTPAQVEAIARTLTLDRNPKAIADLITMLGKLPPSPQRDHFVEMAQALLLQLQAAQSTTQTLQQIDQVIKSPGIAEVRAAVQPLPPAVIAVIAPKTPAPMIREPEDYRPPAVTPALLPALAPAAATVAQNLSYAALLTLTGTRLLQSGMKGPDVGAWQTILRKDGYTATVEVDNAYGPKTAAATKDWQKRRGLTSDGKVGPKTRAKVGTPPVVVTAASTPQIVPQPAAPSAQRLVFASVVDPTPKAKTLTKANATKAEALSLQNILTALGYGSVIGKPDGVWGAKTSDALRALQLHAQSRYKDTRPIGVDGSVGPQTRRIIVARTAELRGVVVSGRRAA